jgi:tRNA(adenine34) deaminase
MHKSDQDFMALALLEAKKAHALNEVPVGAIIVKNGIILGSGFNKVIAEHSVTSHAEINAILAAGIFLKNYRLVNTDMYISLEPCHMCAKAIVDARIKNVFFSTPEPKTGAIISVDNFFDKKYLNHKVNYQHGLLQKEGSKLLKDFFQSKRRFANANYPSNSHVTK